MKIFLLLLTLVLPVAVSISNTNAATPKPNATFQPVIQSLGKGTVTVVTGRHAGYKYTVNGTTQAPANIKTYRITQDTSITVNGLAGTIDSLKAGMAVRVTSALTPDIAESIIANTVAKALPTPTPHGHAKNVPQGAVIGLRVLNVTKDTVTVANPGSKAAAYRIIPRTVITVNGASTTVDAIKKGMLVTVSSDGTTATQIMAQDSHDPTGTKLAP